MSAKNVRRSRFSETPNGGDLTINGQQQPLQGPAVQSRARVDELVAFKKKEIEKQKKLIEIEAQKARYAELVAKLQSQIPNKLAANVPVSTNPVTAVAKPASLILNAEGRTVDVTGKEVQLIQRTPDLKANIRNQKREQFTRITQEKVSESGVESDFFDSRVVIKAPVRPKKTFKFFEKGTFEHIGETLRKKARLEELQKQIGQSTKKTGISSAARLALLNSIESKKEEKFVEVPDIEWWDVYVLKDESYNAAIENQAPVADKFEGITHLIEHPMQLQPPAESNKPVALPVFLTKKEQKKLRRQNRREAWKDKQEKIRLGLEPPPEPKVKMSNMMRVLGTQAVQDPTKIEAHVREQVAKRQRQHEESNASRKLTAEQLKEKKLKKVKEDTSLGVHVAVYRVLSLTNLSKKFKVETNAKQLTMTGIAMLYKNINVVVVEGGPKQQKKFKQLMLNRIKWEEESVPIDPNSTNPDAETRPNACFLVWEGMIKSRSFGEFKIKSSPNESFAKELFKNHQVPHYWDLVCSAAILESTDV